MSMESDFRDLILADATVLGLISTRLWYEYEPQGPTNPSGVYHITGANRELTHDGASGLAVAHFEFTWYAATDAAAKAVAEAVRAAINGLGLIVQGSTTFCCIELQDESSGHEDFTGLYFRNQSFYVTYQES